MPLAVCIDRWGGPDVLVAREIDVPPPGPGEVQMAQAAAGVNMFDIRTRAGDYRVGEAPLVPGIEGAGTVTAVGPDVTEFAPGDRVAYAAPPAGGYAQCRNVSTRHCAKLPDAIGFVQAAASMVSGLTAQMMVRRVHAVGPHTTCLVHSAAGKTGSAIAAWATSLGARVVGTVSSEAKRDAAARHCASVVNYREAGAQARLKAALGEGADVVYDGVGAETFALSLACVARTGTLVTYGQSSGPPPPVHFDRLPPTFSGAFARPSVFVYNRRRPDFLAAVADLWQAVERGAFELPQPAVYALADAKDAHRAIESRATTGALVLRC